MASEIADFIRREIESRLNAFFDGMGRWEAECKAVSRKLRKGELDQASAKLALVASLKSIFREFCTTWETPARVKNGLHYSLIPTYGADLEEIQAIEVEGHHARVQTVQRAGIKARLVYRLTYDGEVWRIEDSRKRIGHDGTELAWDL